MRYSPAKHFGNLLILIACLGFLYIYYPIFALYIPFLTPKTDHLATSSYSLEIPKINAYAPIIENVDPWKNSDYTKALKQGVAHAQGSANPGQPGTIFLFAHSSGNPWELTRYNTIFFRLKDLSKGDLITIYKEGTPYHYAVDYKKEVWPNDVKFLEDQTTEQLVLQTCTPIGTDLKRLLVFAKPTN